MNVSGTVAHPSVTKPLLPSGLSAATDQVDDFCTLVHLVTAQLHSRSNLGVYKCLTSMRLINKKKKLHGCFSSHDFINNTTVDGQ